jgi:hypothetical protein
MESPTAALPVPEDANEAVDVEAAADTSELARSLPELVSELKKLRVEMDRKTKLYDHLVGAKGGMLPPSGPADRFSERQSLFTPFAGPEGERISITGGESALRGDLSRASAGSTRYSDSFSSHAASHAGSGRYSHPNYRYHQPQQYQRPTAHRALARQSSGHGMLGGNGGSAWDYSVMWVSGECGISLRNFSSDKVGAQIAVLQHADGVTTGIANCRLGDQLVTVNDERVDDLRFRDIVQKLKTTRRPISLGFRTNQNVQTSPRASASGSSSFAHTAPVSRGSLRQSMGQTFGEDELADRQTTTSSTSSTGTLSDDVELWCKEQEEMHSGLLVLLTETVLRCERLQQEHMDQLQNLMQLSPVDASDNASETSSSSHDKLLALTSPMSAASAASSFSRRSPEDEPSRPPTPPPRRAPPPPVPVGGPQARQAENLVL